MVPRDAPGETWSWHNGASRHRQHDMPAEKIIFLGLCGQKELILKEKDKTWNNSSADLTDKDDTPSGIKERVDSREKWQDL